MKTALAAMVALLVAPPAGAHEAPTGWSYPFNCCADRDCRQVPPAFIKEGRTGYEIVPTGEVISYGDHRVKDSPDGEFHWCSIGGADNSGTVCLFAPPRGM